MGVIIIGAGLAGLTAAVTLAKENISCYLVSVQPSERAQSVLAEGGINAALNNMGEDDSWEHHFADTMKAGCDIADEVAVRGLCTYAPEMVTWLANIGVPFHTVDGVILQRPFGGQKKRRTCYAKSSTGKVLMTALIDEVRKYEAAGLVKRYDRHELCDIVVADGKCTGAIILDTFSGEGMKLTGPVILAFGGMNGMFVGVTTGTTANTGGALAKVFAKGVTLSNLEMIQYHPTTVGIAGKRMLVSEAARGEGGRLYIERDGKPWYFMEEKYPELGNLMPRDVVSRESAFVLKDESLGGQVYLDMTHLSRTKWEKQLPDLREELKHFLGLDPKKKPIPVSPGIHYFMGGIHVDANHATNIQNLYAAGECCSQYHGANRLGGNSLLGAVYGGKVAAETVATGNEFATTGDDVERLSSDAMTPYTQTTTDAFNSRICSIMLRGLGIIRNRESMENVREKLEEISAKENLTELEKERLNLAKAIIESALFRKESRGAHYRTDYPERDEKQNHYTKATMGEKIRIEYHT